MNLGQYYKGMAGAVLALSILTPTHSIAQEVTLRVNVIQAKNEPVFKGFEAFEAYVEEKSEGRIAVELFESNQLGAQGTLVLDLGQGQYDMSATSPGAMAAISPVVSVLNAPYMFRDVDHMLATLSDDVAADLFAQFENDANITVLDGWYYGSRHLTSNTLGTTPDELSDVRMRIYDAPIAYEFANALGTQPSVVAFSELYLALQTGTIDAQENPIPTIHAKKFYEVQDYLILTGHVIEPTLPMINSDTWNGMAPDLQAIVKDGLAKGRVINNDLVMGGERNLIADLIANGMEVVEVPDRSPFEARATVAYEKYTDVWGDGTVARIKAVE